MTTTVGQLELRSRRRLQVAGEHTEHRIATLVEVLQQPHDPKQDDGALGAGQHLFELLAGVRLPIVGLLTKFDKVRPKERLLPLIESYLQRLPRAASVVPVCAPQNDGLETLADELISRLPEGDPLCPAKLPDCVH